MDQSRGQEQGRADQFTHTEPTFRGSTPRGCGKAMPLLPTKPSVPPGQRTHCLLPTLCALQPLLSSTFPPSLSQAGQQQPAKDTAQVCLYFKLPTSTPIPFFFVNKFFQNGKKNPSPFPVPPCHVPKVPTNLRCPACTQPPLIAPAFSSGVSSAIATAAPPPPGNSHLHYHSLLQSRPQAPGSEQQLR